MLTVRCVHNHPQAHLLYCLFSSWRQNVKINCCFFLYRDLVYLLFHGSTLLFLINESIYIYIYIGSLFRVSLQLDGFWNHSWGITLAVTVLLVSSAFVNFFGNNFCRQNIWIPLRLVISFDLLNFNWTTNVNDCFFWSCKVHCCQVSECEQYVFASFLSNCHSVFYLEWYCKLRLPFCEHHVIWDRVKTESDFAHRLGPCLCVNSSNKNEFNINNAQNAGLTACTNLELHEQTKSHSFSSTFC